MFFIMAGGFYLAALLIQDGTADFEGRSSDFVGSLRFVHLLLSYGFLAEEFEVMLGACVEFIVYDAG